jgi:hypothetical protein
MRKFDLFPKLDKQYRVGTNLGGILSILSVAMTVILFYSEIWSYCHPTQRQRLIVDTSRPTGSDGKTIHSSQQKKLNIQVNITFPKVPCYLLHFDVIDPVTDVPMQIENVQSEFVRLDKNGKRIEKNFDSANFFKSQSSDKSANSCYIANIKETCEDCESVFKAHRNYHISPPLIKNVKQCEEAQKRIDSMKEEGCSINAAFDALRISSEFRISPGFSWDSKGLLIHNVSVFGLDFADINLTHTIHSIKFNKLAGPFPLDNTTSVQTEKRAYRYVYNSDILDDNFTATEFTIPDPRGFSPGVIFKYDISPISGQSYSDREPILHLCTRLLTVIGGVLGVFRALDKMFFSVRKRGSEEIIQPQTNVK